MTRRMLKDRATLNLGQLLEPSDVAVEGKSTWWLCLAKEELSLRLNITVNSQHPTLRPRLLARYQLVDIILEERLRRGQTELPNLKRTPQGGYHVDVRVGRVR